MSMGYVAGGAGGVWLNFKVLGGTVQPENPRENALWVNTDVKITAWSFSGVGPENPIEGEVWIVLGSNGSLLINLLKKNAVKIAVLGAKQYISGAWVDKGILGYRDGVWQNTITYAYYKGNLYEHFTGGWNAMGIKTDSNYPKAAAPKVTYDAESIKLVEGSGTTNQQSGRFHTVNKIDLTPFKAVTINVTSIHTDGGTPVLTVVSEHGEYRADNRKASLSLGTGQNTLDISAVNEACYVCIDLYRNASITFNEVVLDV